jgi:outer membrane protein
MQADLKKKQSEIETMIKTVQAKAAALSKEAKQKQERDLQIKMMDLKALEKQYNEELQKYKAMVLLEMKKDVFEIARDIGKKGNYLLIMDMRQGGIIYSPSTIDITDQVIVRYNEKFGRKALKSLESLRKKKK